MSRQITRRSLLGSLAAASILQQRSIWSAVARTADDPHHPVSSRSMRATADGPFILPPLRYDYLALEPFIDQQTMQFHHDNHHGTYVTNVNNAIKGTEFDSWSIEQLLTNLDKLPDAIRTAVRNNGGGHYNHTMFWEIMAPAGTSAGPSGALAEAITRDFGSLEALNEAVNKAGLGRFGSGWAWVVFKEGTLAVFSTPNQDNPLMDGSGFPILGVDVWEHAYYLKYQYRRGEYLANWWNVVNWDAVAARYAEARAA